MRPCSISRPKSACGQLSPSSSSKHRLYCYLRAFPLIGIDEAMRHVSWGLLVTSRPFHFVIWVMNQLKLVQGVGHPLSPPQRPLCIVGRLGRKKKRTHRPPCAFYFFDYWYFDGDTQREPLRRRKGLPYLPCHRIFKSCKPGVEIWEQLRNFIRSWIEEALIRNKVQSVKSR